MDKPTLDALRASIAKWEAVVAGHGVDDGGRNCALCRMSVRAGDFTCPGCPVREASGRPGCLGTPYDDWRTICCQLGHFPGLPILAAPPDDQPALRAAAQEELDFLRSLLPEGER